MHEKTHNAMIRVSNSINKIVGLRSRLRKRGLLIYMSDSTMKLVHGQSGDIFSDFRDDGKERPWKEKKISNAAYYEALSVLGFKKADSVASCAEVLEFNVLKDSSKKLKSAWFCKSPLCPICNWRRSMKHSRQMVKVIGEVVRRKPTARWLFLTLTVKNVWSGDELDESLKHIHRALNRLFKYKKVSKNLIGYVRSTELTVNPKNGSYNQHIHVLLCVKSTYFKNKENYIEQGEWTSLWQRAAKLDYTPIVHIQTVKDIRKKEITNELPSGIQSAIKETGKYAVKDSDYLSGDIDEDIAVVADLEVGLRGKRMIGWGGLLKELHATLNLSNLDDNLVQTDDTEKVAEEVAYTLVAVWHWKKENYFVQ